MAIRVTAILRGARHLRLVVRHAVKNPCNSAHWGKIVLERLTDTESHCEKYIARGRGNCAPQGMLYTRTVPLSGKNDLAPSRVDGSDTN